MNVRIVIEVSEKDLKNLLITAVEGNVGYWAEFKDYSYKKGVVTLREHNDQRDETKKGPWVKVTTRTMAQGMRLCAKAADNEGGWAFTTWLKDRIGDALTADIMLQFGALKELKYG